MSWEALLEAPGKLREEIYAMIFLAILDYLKEIERHTRQIAQKFSSILPAS